LLRYLEKLCVVSILGLIAVVFMREFFDLNFLNIIETIFLIFVIVTCIILAKGPAFYLSLLGLLTGHLLLYKYDMGFDIWLDGMTKNIPLAILFVMVPVLSIPLKQGGYLKVFNYYISKYRNRSSGLFLVLTGLVFSLGSLTNLGSIRITHDLVKEAKFPTKFLAKVYAVGFAASIAWSPYFGSVNLILHYTGVSFSRYVIFGLIYSFCILLAGNLLFYTDLTSKNEVRMRSKLNQKVRDDNKKIKQLVLNLVGLLATVIIGEKIFDFSNMMLLVGVIAVFYAALWAILIKKFTFFLQELKGYDKKILQVKNEIVFFISVGFFGVVLANTPLQNFIEKFFQSISGFSTFFLVEIIIIITALLSSIGIHQVITITALGLSLQPGVLGLSDLSFALTLLASWIVAMIVSPFAPFNIIAGGLLKESPFHIGFKWNRLFGILVVIFSGIYIIFVNSFI